MTPNKRQFHPQKSQPNWASIISSFPTIMRIKTVNANANIEEINENKTGSMKWSSSQFHRIKAEFSHPRFPRLAGDFITRPRCSIGHTFRFVLEMRPKNQQSALKLLLRSTRRNLFHWWRKISIPCASISCAGPWTCKTRLCCNSKLSIGATRSLLQIS